MLSNKQINKIGESIKIEVNEDNLNKLVDYRDQFLGPIFEISLGLKKLLSESNYPFLLSGRLKRIKSIIRKLKRPQNKNMDLTRMADIAGIRILVDNISDQDGIFDYLKSKFDILKIFDYREIDQNYKSLHFHLIDENNKTIEIQLRTLGQHTWADESESFGEQAKENKGSKKTLDFLTSLSKAIYLDERGKNYQISLNEYFKTRNPMNNKLLFLKKNFPEISKSNIEFSDNYLFIIVFDNETKTTIYNEKFYSTEANEALTELKRLSTYLDDDRYEYLLMSSQSLESLKLTHPRYFFIN